MPLAKFIHPAKVCLFCTILVIIVFCLLNFFVNKRCLTFFLLMLICGFLEWMHVWKFVSNAVLIGFEMNIYEQWTYLAIISDSNLSECFILWKLWWFSQLLILSKLRPTFDCNLSSSALRRERSHFFPTQQYLSLCCEKLPFRFSHLCDMMTLTIQTISKISWLAGCGPNLQCLAYFLITPH